MALSPLYTIHQYREDMYKVVAFKGVRDPDVMYVRDREEQQHNEVKLDSNFSRARNMVLQYALCNPWEYFFTGTLAQQKMDRYDLDTYAARLVPEHHKDGAWHIHGLVHGLPESVVSPFLPPAPRHLIEGGFLNWPDYQEKFGFCSLAPIRDPIATAYYITKYVSKDLARRSQDLGKHLYFHSRPLQKAEKASEVYLYQPQLDMVCVNDYDFCKTGMVEDAHWSFPYIWEGSDFPSESLDPKPLRDPLAGFDPRTIDPIYAQIRIPL